MMHSSRSQPSGSTSNASALRQVFVQRVHQLLQLGYDQLTPASHVSEEEPAITGFLVESIDKVLSDRAKAWMRLFSVHDDPPVNDGRRKGKRRKRVDLRIDSAHFTPRARFRFEAKRLGRGHPVSVYLGPKGLGCFLCGDYAREDDEAGMLGYVQSGGLDEWGQKIGDELANHPKSYDVVTKQPFSSHPMPFTISLKTYRSQHERASVGRSIFIIHTLFLFH